MPKRTKTGPKSVETLTHAKAKRKNIPTAELQSSAERKEEQSPLEPLIYKRAYPLEEGTTRERDQDLDPQLIWNGTTLSLTPEQIKELANTGKLEIGNVELVWRGKDTQDWSDLIVQAPPLYIQEKVHPKHIIEDLKRQSEMRAAKETNAPDFMDVFEDFNGIDPKVKTEFYQHDQNWQNRMILGDCLHVMASLTEREGLRGKVQCIYFDPPYGIKFNSNWQVSTRFRDVKDGKLNHITREPEQVKAFRDTWKHKIHSYLTYLRDRIVVMRELLADSGSIFIQIGDENMHRVKAILDEVFGEKNLVTTIIFQTTPFATSTKLPSVQNYLLWYARDADRLKSRHLFKEKDEGSSIASYRSRRLEDGQTIVPVSDDDDVEEMKQRFRLASLSSPGASGKNDDFEFQHEIYNPGSSSHWKIKLENLPRVAKAGRLQKTKNSLRFRSFIGDFPKSIRTNIWTDTTTGSFTEDKIYVVQTNTKVVERCILMATDPGDLVLDPTCGSGTTATVAEQWGRRWVTVDTSRVSLALARMRLMGARYPYYLLLDSPEGREKEWEVSEQVQPEGPTLNDIRLGFVYERTPHIMLSTISNNAEIDVIWDNYQAKMEPLRASLNQHIGTKWEEWEIPKAVENEWSKEARELHTMWWDLRIDRQKEIDESIAQRASVELLHDSPYEDDARVRVAGPFTVESLSPHRVVPTHDEGLVEKDDGTECHIESSEASFNDFTDAILESLKSAGIHRAIKTDHIAFNSIEGWPGKYIAAEGNFHDGENEKRAAILIGPAFGTITRAHLTAAASEASEAGFDVLIACGFNFDAHSSDLDRMGPLPILKAKMNQDLHMSEELKNTGKGNLFTIIGEPDIRWHFDDVGSILVEVLGLDVFDLKTSEIRNSEKDDIAAWFIDTDYNEESFFVRHAYFLGAKDPYKALKRSLKAEINEEAWETLYRDVSRPFPRPKTGRFAVKVINHFGDEVMKVFSV